MEFNFWKIMGLVGTVSEELAEAFADDQKIDAIEMLKLGSVVAEKLSLPVDIKTQKIINVIIKTTDEVLLAAEDNVITVDEINQIIAAVCESLDINIFDGIKV